GICGRLSGGWHRRSEVGGQRNEARADTEVLPGFHEESGCGHKSPPERKHMRRRLAGRRARNGELPVKTNPQLLRREAHRAACMLLKIASFGGQCKVHYKNVIFRK